MKFSYSLFCLVIGIRSGAYSLPGPSPVDAALSSSPTFQPRYRISPIDGSTIALPTAEQLAWQDMEIGILIHFNMGTYYDGNDGCPGQANKILSQSVFDPTLINIDQWMDAIAALGGRYATLTAKHNCGFTTWPSDVSFNTIDNQTIQYNYTIAQSPLQGQDIVLEFFNSAQKYNIGHGFYYSVVINNFLNVQNAVVGTTGYVPGQVKVTNETFDQIATDQLTELWTKYGKFTEIWFDGGYNSALEATLESLLNTNQPQAIIFGGCKDDGSFCLTENSVRWVGTETGPYPEENWSSGTAPGAGSPTSQIFCPSECDTTLQTADRWFYGSNQGLRSLEDMINTYHATVGHNCFLELDLAPDRTGLIPVDQAARYKQLGDFIKACYGNQIPYKITRNDTGTFSMSFDQPTLIDRIVLMEDQTNGQVIRSYQVHAKFANGTTTLVSTGSSVGHKRIDLFGNAINATELTVNSTYVDTPIWRSVSAHLCNDLPNLIGADSIIQAEAYDSNNGTQTQATSDTGGGENVGWIHNGNWLGYYNVNFGSPGASNLVARIAAQNSVSGTIHITLDSPVAQPIGSISVSGTGGWQSWVNASTAVSGASGLHDVYLTFTSDKPADFVNVNWFTFV